MGEPAMKYASENLKNEHEGILGGLNILGKMANGLAAGKRARPSAQRPALPSSPGFILS
jgi:hypothetical protein